ncbi:MarR family transcriptional regulator [Streptomyces sp. SBR177]
MSESPDRPGDPDGPDRPGDPDRPDGPSGPVSPGMDERQAQAPDRLRALPSRLLALTSARADRLVGERLAVEGARKWHYAVLASLDAYGPASQADLSRRTGIYRSDLVAVINELEAGGHVARTPTPTTVAATSSPSLRRAPSTSNASTASSPRSRTS